MVVIIGLIIILGCAAVPWAFHAADGNLGAGFAMLGTSFWVPTEYITIAGLGVGAMVIMAPAQVLKKVFRNSLRLSKAFHIRKKSTQIYSWQCMKCSCWGEKME